MDLGGDWAQPINGGSAKITSTVFLICGNIR